MKNSEWQVLVPRAAGVVLHNTLTYLYFCTVFTLYLRVGKGIYKGLIRLLRFSSDGTSSLGEKANTRSTWCCSTVEQPYDSTRISGFLTFQHLWISCIPVPVYQYVVVWIPIVRFWSCLLRCLVSSFLLQNDPWGESDNHNNIIATVLSLTAYLPVHQLYWICWLLFDSSMEMIVTRSFAHVICASSLS